MFPCTYVDCVNICVGGGSIVLQQNTMYVLNSRDLTNKYNVVVGLDMDDKGMLE